MLITRAGTDDIKELNILINRAYRGETSKKGWTTEADLLDGLRTDEETLAEMMNKEDAVILKYGDEEHKIKGCVYLQKQNENLYLGMLTVDPNTQGNGIGKQLLKAATEHALEKNCSSIVMTVISIRDELIAWYGKHGYHKTGETKPFHANEKFGKPKQPLEFVVLEKKI